MVSARLQTLWKHWLEKDINISSSRVQTYCTHVFKDDVNMSTNLVSAFVQNCFQTGYVCLRNFKCLSVSRWYRNFLGFSSAYAPKKWYWNVGYSNEWLLTTFFSFFAHPTLVYCPKTVSMEFESLILCCCWLVFLLSSSLLPGGILPHCGHLSW